MVSNRIEREILIEAPVEVVWGVVTEPNQICGWFSDAAEIDLRPGGEGTLSWDQKATNERATVRIHVESVEPPHTFSFRWVHPAGTQARPGNSLLVEFTLIAEGENTRLRLVERGLLEMDWSEEAKAKYADEHGKGWDVHLASLRDYVSRQSPASAPR
jgi:uncharacterized protein YndB with AHSA1/START domain